MIYNLFFFYPGRRRIETEKETGRRTKTKRETKTEIETETGKTEIEIGVRTKTKIGKKTETRTEEEGPAASHVTVIAKREVSQGNARRSLGLALETVTAGGSLAPDHGTDVVGLGLGNVAAPEAKAVIVVVKVEVVTVGEAAAGTIAVPGQGAKLLNSK